VRVQNHSRQLEEVKGMTRLARKEEKEENEQTEDDK
jgi:hypothetical protein